MRLLVTTDVTTRGGVDGYVLDLVAALRSAGNDSHVALEATTTSPLRDAVDALPGLTIHRVPLYHRRHPPQDLERSARALLARVKPDGIHVVCGSPRSCLVLREAAVKLGIPTAITEQQIRDDLDLLPSEVGRIRNTYRAARAVVFVSKGNQARMARVVALDGVRHMVIPNGVDVAEVSRRASCARHVSRRRTAGSVMTAARFSPEKGLDVLVRAVSLLPASLVAEVNLYGDGDERAALEKLVAALGLQRRISFRPWAVDIPEQMVGHDLFVLPSLAEGMPYALLEAMAAGIPVIASDVPGSAEALDGGRVGTLVPRGDPAALAAAIRGRLTKRDETRDLVLRARRRVRDQYDLSDQMRRTILLWQHTG